jgi:putative YphP/YqiW family bacilliredoxin
MSLMSAKKPDHMVTVFAGMEADATAKARDYFKPYRPSSPQIALMKDGKVLKMWQRQDIEDATRPRWLAPSPRPSQSSAERGRAGWAWEP